jgi:hypothetical protein
MHTRAREKASRILAEHHPVSLGEDTAAQLDEIVQEAEARALKEERNERLNHRRKKDRRKDHGD